MSRKIAFAMCGAIAATWLTLRLCGFDLPNPPMMQSYSLACGWKNKAMLASHALQYLACMVATVCRI